MSTKKTFTIPYQYVVIGHATVHAESLEDAVELIEHKAPCPMPLDHIDDEGGDISKVSFYFLEDAFEIHREDLDLYGNPKDSE